MATLEGTLSKWTNVMKGWQNRWFVLESETSLLSYYTVSWNFFVGEKSRIAEQKKAICDKNDTTWIRMLKTATTISYQC